MDERMHSKRILAKDRYVSNDTRETGLNNNDIVIGGSGSGKTGGYVIPNIRQPYGSLIITDTKGNLYKKYGKELKAAGYAVRVLDFINPRNSTFSYNPLEYIRREPKTQKYSELDIMTLARTLAPEICEKDPFWNDCARTVLSFLLAFTLEALPEKEHNMSSVAELFRVVSDSGNTKICDEWEVSHPESLATKKYQMFKHLSDADRTWSCVMQVAAEALEIFGSEEVVDLYAPRLRIGKSERIEDLGNKKMALFLNISDTDRSRDRLINVFYTQALHQLCNAADRNSNSRLKVPVRFILDDFAANAYIPDFDKIISIIRSREISVSLILQSLTQLQTMYKPAQAITIINNCDHMIYLGSQDLESAKHVGYRACKTMESVLSMPLDKAYLMERGRKAELVNKIKPYSEEYRSADDREMEQEAMPEKITEKSRQDEIVA